MYFTIQVVDGQENAARPRCRRAGGVRIVDLEHRAETMRLTCFIYSLGTGGAERVMSVLASAWAERGHEVVVATYDEGQEPFYPLHPAVKVARLRLSGGSLARRIGNHLRRVPTFRRMIRSTRPDAVVSFMDRTNVLVLLATRGLGIPVVVSVHIDPLRSPPGFPYDQLRFLLYRRAGAVVVLSRGQAEWFERISDRVVLIPNPVQASPGGPGPHEGRGPVVVAAGRLTRQKGFDLLLTAFAKVAGEHPAWKLAIHGEGPERPALERQVRTLGLGGRVEMPGITTDLAAHLRTAGFFVLSSRFEGFPMVLAEALAAGCPVVAANCCDGVADLVTANRNGLLVPPDDAEALEDGLRRLMADEGLRRKLGENGPEVARRFGAASIVARWEELFRGLS